MKFIIFVKSNEEAEKGVLPDKELFVDMEKYNQKLKDAGVLITLDGLEPSSKGVRVSFSNSKPTVADGPFPKSKELVAGYWIIKVKSKEDAINWAKQIPFKGGVVEVRQIQDITDFPPEIQNVLSKK